MVISHLVGKAQPAFIEGRSIVENIIVSHEIFKSYNRKWISPRCVRKAYEIMEWDFLGKLLSDLGFPIRFVNWIMKCVSIVSYSLILNEGLTKPFLIKRGLRQGDPMSSDLFVLVMEYLGRELQQLAKNVDFNYHPRCERMGNIHICFADALLIYYRADIGSFT